MREISVFRRIGFDSRLLTGYLKSGKTDIISCYRDILPILSGYVIACAVSQVSGEYRASIGARPASAMVFPDKEGLMAGGITAESAKAFAEYIAEKAPTESNVRGSAAYRSHLIKVLTERAMLELGGI